MVNTFGGHVRSAFHFQIHAMALAYLAKPYCWVWDEMHLSIISSGI